MITWQAYLPQHQSPITHRSLVSTQPECLFLDPTDDLGKRPYRLSDRTTVVIMPSTTMARLKEQAAAAPA